MASPQDFLVQFRNEMREAGVRFAITSGQACVFYGIQQTTKDSDWIIAPEDLETLVTLLTAIDSARTDNRRVSFQPICGAPISKSFLGNGWTSHIVITDQDGHQHRLDFFGKPPRVSAIERDPVQPDYAAKLTVAQMKKTDREKDWPIVFALGRQAVADGDSRGILHGQDAEWITSVWATIEVDLRDELIRQRPLLGLIDSQATRLRRAIRIERQVWQSVNRGRYQIYQSAWKEFFRQWRREPDFKWPVDARFAQQCEALNSAAKTYGLPKAPLSHSMKKTIFDEAWQITAEIFAATADEIDLIAPPWDVLLP